MTELIRSAVNNFSTVLDGSIDNSQTTFDVIDASLIAAELAITGVDFVAITVQDNTDIEIMHVTSVSTNTLTVVRGREGTSGISFTDGRTVECRPTVETVKSMTEWRPVEVRILGSDTTNIDFIVSDYAGDQKVVFSDVTISIDSQDVYFQQGTGGGPTIQNTTYYASGNWRTYLSGSNNVPSNNQAQLTLLSTASNSALNTIMGEFMMTNPSNASIRHVCRWSFAQQSKDQTGVGIRDNTEAVTAFRFSLASGDFKAGSKFIRYVRNH